MILFRYVIKGVFLSLLAVASVLLLIVLSNSLAHYLGKAASGALDPSVLFWILLYRIPASLEIILPLALFLSVMLTVGRMYMENEVTVLFATGTSEKKLAKWIMVPTVLVTLIVGLISFDLAPRGLRMANDIFAEQKSRSDLDQIVAGRFLEVRGGSGVVYSESVDEGQLDNVFFASVVSDGTPFILMAPYAEQQVIDNSRYLVLKDGERYDVAPGEVGGQILQFKEHGILIPTPDIIESIGKLKTRSTSDLMASGQLEDLAMLQYRLSITLMVPIITLIAVALGRTNPRSGRYARLIPGILMFLLYLILISASKSAIEDEILPIWLGMWWIHLAFLGYAWWIFNANERLMKDNKSKQAIAL